jgi:hypothetical protein
VAHLRIGRLGLPNLAAVDQVAPLRGPGPALPAPGLPDQLEGAPDDGQQSRRGRRGQCRCGVTEHRDHHEGPAFAVGGEIATVATPGSDPPLNQTVGHCAGSSPMPPLLADRMEPSGASRGWAASCRSPAKARQMSSGEANHSMVSMSRGVTNA